MIWLWVLTMHEKKNGVFCGNERILCLDEVRIFIKGDFRGCKLRRRRLSFWHKIIGSRAEEWKN